MCRSPCTTTLLSPFGLSFLTDMLKSHGVFLACEAFEVKSNADSLTGHVRQMWLAAGMKEVSIVVLAIASSTLLCIDAEGSVSWSRLVTITQGGKNCAMRAKIMVTSRRIMIVSPRLCAKRKGRDEHSLSYVDSLMPNFTDSLQTLFLGAVSVVSNSSPAGTAPYTSSFTLSVFIVRLEGNIRNAEVPACLKRYHGITDIHG